ncbi:MAG TPA: PAS domain S-box protein [Pyrinomonadaceae bacterium]
MADPRPPGVRESEQAWGETAPARYVLALASVAAATLLMFALYAATGLTRGSVPFIFYFVAVILVALYGGRGPALLTVALSALTANYFFLGPPLGLALDFNDLLQTGAFAAVSLFISVLADRRARAESAALSSRESLETTLRSIGDAVIATDGRGHVRFMNPVAERLTGWPLAEAEGRPLAEVFRIVNEETRETVESPADKVLREGRVVGLANHTLLLARDGREVPIDDSGAPIRDERGQTAGVVLVFHDVTEQRHAGRERSRLAAIVESSSDAIVGKTLDGTVTSWNAAAEQMYGYTAEEAVGRHISFVVPEELRDDLEEIVRRLARGERVERPATVRLRKDGSRVDVSLTASPVRDPSGRLIGASAIARDITEQKRSVERLRFLAEASRVLGSSLDYETTLEGLARLAVAALADYCLVDLVDDDGRVRRVAVAHADPERQPLADRLRDFPPGPQAAGVPRVLRTGRPEVFAEVTAESLPALARDEEHARVLAALGLKSFLTVPLVARGRTIGALTFSSTRDARRYAEEDAAYAQEIASRAALAIENARLYTRAQEVNRAKDEFLATLSHELRTPLTPILGWTHMIRSGRLGPAETAQGVHVIEKNSHSLSRLINDLLDMSSILSGKMRIERARVELSSVVREAAETVRPQADARSVALEVRAGAGAVVSGDRTRLVQVFWNLLNNAVKFSPEGGRVRVRLRAEDGAARVEVEDDGAGIPAEFLPHVFERFRQADMGTTRAHGGLGLGLALVKSFVEAHGGSVAAESAGEGRGSRFTVALPAAEDGARRPPSGDLEAPPPGQAAGSRRVLVVEDAPDTLEMLRVVFESRGMRASACATPEEALSVAESGRFDIIVSDIGLPRIDGYELLARLRELPHMRGVPALALTGYAAQRDAEAALAAGFDAHVPKPVDPSELAERMEELMGRADSGRGG